MGCKCDDAVKAIPTRHTAGSVGVFDLGTAVLSGPGESWVLGKSHSSQHDECGIPTLANRGKAGEKLAC